MNIIATSLTTAAQTVTIAVLILVLAYLLRCLIRLSQRIRPGATYSIIVEPIEHPIAAAQQVRTEHSAADALVNMLRAYIAEDIQSVWTLVPGAPRLATPEIPAEPPKSSGDWFTSLRFFMFTPPRAYHIVITQLESKLIRVAAQVIKTPGNEIIAAATFEAPALEELVSDVGGYCVEQVQQQRTILRRTPRWEQWANRGGYKEFRRALLLERQGNSDMALAKYCSAGSLSLGNVTVALRRASILERQKRHVEAIQIYHYSHKLWPESIETTYRYAAACSNLRDGGTLQYYQSARASLDFIRRQLVLTRLPMRWLRTWLPNRQNSGEQAYWLSWIKPSHSEHLDLWTRRTKRRDFIFAIDIASRIVSIAEFEQTAKALGEARSNGSEADPALSRHMLEVERLLSRKRIGWLAHYNGACFHSLCSQLDPCNFSSKYDLDDWKELQTGLALQQLAIVIRDPFNELDPAWLLVDPDMEGLRTSATANHWAHFLGISFDEMDSTMGVRVYRRTDPIR